MFTHEQIWRGIDRLAAHARTSPSGLARRAGLDATTFNPSKRFSRDGSKPRWPSTESLAKALAAAHMDFARFAELVTGTDRPDALRSRGLADSQDSDAFDASGHPAGSGWSRVPFPGITFDKAYALTVEGEAMEPVYRRATGWWSRRTTRRAPETGSWCANARARCVPGRWATRPCRR